MDAEEILRTFYGQVVFSRGPKGWARPFDPDAFRGVKLLEPLVDAATGEVVAEAGHQTDRPRARKHRREAPRKCWSAAPTCSAGSWPRTW